MINFESLIKSLHDNTCKSSTVNSFFSEKYFILNQDEFKIFFEALKKNTTVSILTFRWQVSSFFMSDVPKVIAQALEFNQTLKVLDLGSNYLDIESIKAIAASLKKNMTLETLILMGNKFGVTGAKFLFEALRENKKLQNLVLWGTDLGLIGIQYVASEMEHNVTLKSINLGYNYRKHSKAAEMLKDEFECAKAIAIMLGKNKTLKSFNFETNTFENESINFILRFLSLNASLTEIYLCGLSIGLEGIKILSNSIESNKQLVVLGLRSNNIDNQGLKILGHALEKNITLKHLVLCNCLIDKKISKELITIFTKNRSLTFVDLSENDLSPEVLQGLSRILERNKLISKVNKFTPLMNAKSPPAKRLPTSKSMDTMGTVTEPHPDSLIPDAAPLQTSAPAHVSLTLKKPSSHKRTRSDNPKPSSNRVKTLLEDLRTSDDKLLPIFEAELQELAEELSDTDLEEIEGKFGDKKKTGKDVRI